MNEIDVYNISIIGIQASIVILSAAERRGTPVLLSASVSDNSDNSAQMAAPRRSREITNQRSAFMLDVGTQITASFNDNLLIWAKLF